LQYPDITTEVAKEIAGHFKDRGITCVIGPALGGIIIAYKVAEALGVRSVFGERQAGQMCIRRGFELKAGEKVLVMEDVITTGKSVKELIEVIRQYDVRIVGVASIVDRSGGGVDFGYEFFSLLEIDLVTWQPDQCPPEFKDIPAVKPGSRGIN
jgi:orotate phosphoribosyltransferase